MRKYQRHKRPPLDPVTALAKDITERSRLELQVMESLVKAFTTELRYQRRFRMVVLDKFVRIEQMVEWLVIGHTAQVQRAPGYYSDKVKADMEEIDNRFKELNPERVIELLKIIHDDADFETLSNASPKRKSKN